MDVTSKQKKKIVKYIIDDRYKKLAKYLSKEKIDLNSIINKKGEKMLHICCREGSTDCLEYLIDKGAKVNLVDKEGNLPIHLALQYCLQEYSASLEQKLVSTLLTYSSSQLHRQNIKGVSVKDLLDQLNKLKVPPDQQIPDSPVLLSSDSDDREYSDKKWREKLQYECDQEFESLMGRYEEDDVYYSVGGGRESYDDWADRIYAAFSARQKKIYGKNHSERRQKSSEESENKNKQQKKKESWRQKPDAASCASSANVEKLRAARKHKRIREMYDKLFSSGEEVTVEDIPFDGMNPPEIIDIMLKQSDGEDKEAIKRLIREELRRWHPDKFKQKIGSRVRSGQIQSVMDKVKTIAQALTSFGQ